ncbi:hypothetical protein B7463_g1818, partial [Scytalidium lignicola]
MKAQSRRPRPKAAHVAVLHDIIVHAQELLPGLPERERLPTNALFTAYYDILPKIGINADHDSRYARVLFKVGGMRGPESLYEKFEEVLARMGIEIEFDHEDSEEGRSKPERLAAISNTQPPPNARPQQPEAIDQIGRPRRNSESSVWDLSNDSPVNRDGRPRSGFSIPNEIRPNERDQGLPLQRPLLNHVFDNPMKLATMANMANEKTSNLDGRIDRRNLNGKPKGRGRSISSHTSMRVHRRSDSRGQENEEQVVHIAPVAVDEYKLGSHAVATISTHEQLSPGRSQRANQGEEGDQQEDLMQIRYSLFSQSQPSYLVRHQFQQWRRKVSQLQRDNFNLELVAVQQDKKVLIRQALEAWYNRWRKQQQANEVRNFFAHLERRAGRARNLFLVQKAFTHWIQSAIDEIQRTSAARRYIIRTRIFNAWKDVTAVNELKIASDWQIRMAKQRAFLTWIASQRKLSHNDHVANETKQLHLLKNAWQIWKLKIHEQNWRDHQANTIFSSTICRSTLRRWRRETQFAPAQVVVDHDINTRLLRSTFNLWLLRSQQELQANQFDRMRILREAWISWTHQLRAEALRSRIQNRLVAQILYKWVLVERMALAQRLQNQSCLRRCFKVWAHLSIASQEQNAVEEVLAFHQAASHTKHLMIRHFISSFQQQKYLESIAAERYPSQMLRGTLCVWSGQARHLLQLQELAHDAAFYFLASKSLKMWRESTENAKREKRRIAYSHVRRSSKLNVAKRAFVKWRRQAKHVSALQVQASDMLRSKDMIIAYASDVHDKNSKRTFRKMFTYWRQKASQRRQFERNGTGTINIPIRRAVNQGQSNAWSDFGDEPEPERLGHKTEMAEMQTPIPGYLNTPSKRNERVLAAAARFSSTTPRVPLSAPMERHLRAQYSGGALLFRKKLGTRASNVTGFADIKEARTITDDNMD